jgi:hypothetical protein
MHRRALSRAALLFAARVFALAILFLPFLLLFDALLFLEAASHRRLRRPSMPSRRRPASANVKSPASDATPGAAIALARSFSMRSIFWASRSPDGRAAAEWDYYRSASD